MASESSSVSSMAPYAPGLENAIEQREPVELRVEGTIPPWLEGVLFRTGPGTMRVPTGNKGKTVDIQHWFDGFAMHHRFDIIPASDETATSSRVLYRSRKGATDAENRVAKEGKYNNVTFAQKDPCETIFSKFSSTYQRAASGARRARETPSSSNVGVTITPDMPGFSSHSATKDLKGDAFAQYVVAKTDANVLQLLDATTLEPLDLTTYKMYDDRLTGELAAAHATRDPVTGDMFNYTLNMGPKPVYTVFRISNGKSGEPEGKVKILAQISGAPPAYLHSFAMTEKYVILIVWQADITMNGISILTSGSVLGSIEQKWDPARKTQMFVIDRHDGGLVARYTAPAFFCFHQLNAFDEGDDIVMDISCYETHDVLNLLYLHNLRAATVPPHVAGDTLHGYGRRFRLSAVSSQSTSKRSSKAILEAKIEWTSKSTIELPTVHPYKYHTTYRYVYGITTSPYTREPGKPRQFADGLIKIDVQTLEEKIWRRDGYTAGEPIFVPRPAGESEEVERDEDDGVLLSVVLDAEKGKSALVVLDVKTMEEVGRAEMDAPFPYGFHGAWRGAGAPRYATRE